MIAEHLGDVFPLDLGEGAKRSGLQVRFQNASVVEEAGRDELGGCVLQPRSLGACRGELGAFCSQALPPVEASISPTPVNRSASCAADEAIGSMVVRLVGMELSLVHGPAAAA